MANNVLMQKLMDISTCIKKAYDVISEKEGTYEKANASNLADAISSIEIGGKIQDPSTVNISKVGKYTIEPKIGFDGLGKIDVSVYHKGTLDIIKDGTYNVNDYASVKVSTNADTLLDIIKNTVQDRIIKYETYDQKPLSFSGSLYNNRIDDDNPFWLIYDNAITSDGGKFKHATDGDRRNKLSKLEFPQYISTLGSEALSGTELEEFKFNGNYIDDRAFYNAKIGSLVFGAYLTYCGQNIFNGYQAISKDSIQFGDKFAQLTDLTNILANIDDSNGISFDISDWSMGDVKTFDLFGKYNIDHQTNINSLADDENISIFNDLGKSLENPVVDIYNISGIYSKIAAPMTLGLYENTASDVLNTKRLLIKLDDDANNPFSGCIDELEGKGWYIMKNSINAFKVDMGSVYEKDQKYIEGDYAYFGFENVNVYINNDYDPHKYVYVKLDNNVSTVDITYKSVNGDSLADTVNIEIDQCGELEDANFNNMIYSDITCKKCVTVETAPIDVYIKIDESDYKLLIIDLHLTDIKENGDLSEIVWNGQTVEIHTNTGENKVDECVSISIFPKAVDDDVNIYRYLGHLTSSGRHLTSTESDQDHRYYIPEQDVYNELLSTESYIFTKDVTVDENTFDDETIKYDALNIQPYITSGAIIDFSFDLNYCNLETNQKLIHTINEGLQQNQVNIADRISEQVIFDTEAKGGFDAVYTGDPISLFPLFTITAVGEDDKKNNIYCEILQDAPVQIYSDIDDINSVLYKPETLPLSVAIDYDNSKECLYIIGADNDKNGMIGIKKDECSNMIGWLRPVYNSEYSIHSDGTCMFSNRWHIALFTENIRNYCKQKSKEWSKGKLRKFDVIIKIQDYKYNIELYL